MGCQALCGVSGLMWATVALGSLRSAQLREEETMDGTWIVQALAMLSAAGGSATWALQAGFNYRVTVLPDPHCRCDYMPAHPRSL